MTRFDFLHPSNAVIRLSIPEAWRGTGLLAAACISILFGLHRIETVRLTTARALQSVYESRLAQIEAGGRQRARTYQRVRELSAVLERASGIAGSARKQARVIAVVAEALPPHVWLTSIRRDDAGLLLQGKAGGLSGIATLVRRLSASRVLRRPLLSSVTMPEGNLRAEPLTYTLHVDVAAQS